MGVRVDGVSPKALMEVDRGPEQPVLSKLPEFAVGHVSPWQSHASSRDSPRTMELA